MSGLMPTPQETQAANIHVSPNNGGAAPAAPVVPINPTPVQLANRTAAANNGGTLPGTLPASPSVAPASTASFNGLPQGKTTAPAVITSKQAEDHLGEMKTALEGAKTDLQNMRLYQAQKKAITPPITQNNPAGGDGQTADAQSGNTTQTNDLDEQINSVLDGLTGNQNGDASGTESNPTPDQQQTIDNDNSGIQQDQEAQAQVAQTLDAMDAGTYPLSPTEQAQVAAVKDQYASALKAAQDYETAKGLGATAANAANGMEMYSPAEAIGNIHAAIKEGAVKVQDINTRVIDAQAKLQQSLQSDDYKTASKLYGQISSDIKLRSDEIGKISTALTKNTDTLQKNALAVAKLQISSILSSDKIDATQKQSLVNNALKSGTLDEKTRHDAATELAAQKKAAASGKATTKPAPQTVTDTETWLNSTRGPDKYVDPNAYQQAFDAWTNDGHQAKDFIANYPPKDFVNPENDWLPKYLASKTATKATTDVAAKIKAAFSAPGSKFGQ